MEPSQEQFSISLPSDSEADNSPQSFRTRLPNHIKLDERWEVALHSIVYTFNWHNVLNNSLAYKKAGDVDWTYTSLPHGHYNTPRLLARSMTALLREAKINVTASDTHIMHFLVPNGAALRIDDNLSYVLGFTTRGRTLTGYVKADRAVALNWAPVIYVYTDIIESQIIGNTHAPLLEVIPVQGNFGDIVQYSPRHLRFIPLRTNNLSTINIELKDSFGDPVAFNGGLVVLQLQFRRAQ